MAGRPQACQTTRSCHLPCVPPRGSVSRETGSVDARDPVIRGSRGVVARSRTPWDTPPRRRRRIGRDREPGRWARDPSGRFAEETTRPMTLLLAAVGAVVTALIELTVTPYLRIGSAQPHPVLVLAVIVTIAVGLEAGLVWAFVGGLALDVLAPRPLGSTAFALLLCVGGASLLARSLASPPTDRADRGRLPVQSRVLDDPFRDLPSPWCFRRPPQTRSRWCSRVPCTTRSWARSSGR